MPVQRPKPAELFLFIICYSVNIYFFLWALRKTTIYYIVILYKAEWFHPVNILILIHHPQEVLLD